MIGWLLFPNLSYYCYRGFIGRILLFRQLQKLSKKVFAIGSNLGHSNTNFGNILNKNTLKYVNYIL